MKSLNKMVAVFTALATLATASGVGTYSAFAQSVGVNTGVKAVQPVGFNAVVGSQAGGSNAQVQLQGASMRGTVVNVKVGAVVNQKATAQAGVVAPGTQVQMAAPVISNVGPTGATPVVNEAMEGPSKTGPPSFIKEVKAQQAGVAAMASPRVSAEQASYQGKVQFDLAAKNAALNGATPVTVSAESTVKPGSVLAKPAMNGSTGKYGPLPTVPEKATPQLGSKLSTFVDALIVTAVGTYTQSVTAAYAALVVVSSLRYAPDFIKALSNDSKNAQSGFLRAATVGGMALVAAPVAFVYESYKNLLVPFVTNVVKLVKNVGIAIKDAAVWTYNNIIVPVARAIRDFAKAAWQLAKDAVSAVVRMIKEFAKAAWEFAKDAARFVRDVVVDFAKAVKQLAIDFYNNVVVPVARFIKQVAIDAARAIKQLAKDFVQFLKDLVKGIDQILTDIANAIANAATWVYDNVMTPVGHAIRGLSAGAIAGIAAAVVVAGPFVVAAAISFIVKPIHAIGGKMGKWPVAFRIAAAIVAIPLIGTAILVSYKAVAALAGLTLTGSVLVGFGGAAIEGVKEGYTNGFVAGIKKGYGDAVKLATGALETAKANYNAWKATNVK